jgi:transposase
LRAPRAKCGRPLPSQFEQLHGGEPRIQAWGLQIMTRTARFVGIDVSKGWLDVAVAGQVERIANEPVAIRALADRLQEVAPDGIGLEPTGGYERLAVAILREAGFVVLQVDSWRLRQFAKSRGKRAKTDPLDARLIEAYLGENTARPFPDPSQGERELRSWAREIGRAEADIRRLQNRMEGCETTAIEACLKREIEGLRTTVRMAEQEIERLLESLPALKDRHERLLAVPGVGPKTARLLIVELPELGHLDARQIAAVAGLAPYQRQSGKRRRPAHIEGGRHALKRGLYLLALAARLHNPWAAKTFANLRARAKPYKIALIALARKFLVRLNAMIRTNSVWADAQI